MRKDDLPVHAAQVAPCPAQPSHAPKPHLRDSLRPARQCGCSSRGLEIGRRAPASEHDLAASIREHGHCHQLAHAKLLLNGRRVLAVGNAVHGHPLHERRDGLVELGGLEVAIARKLARLRSPPIWLVRAGARDRFRTMRANPDGVYGRPFLTQHATIEASCITTVDARPSKDHPRAGERLPSD